VLLGLTEPQVIGVGLIAVGVGLWLYFRAKGPSLPAAAV
jgi:hypothetical protein